MNNFDVAGLDIINKRLDIVCGAVNSKMERCINRKKAKAILNEIKECKEILKAIKGEHNEQT